MCWLDSKGWGRRFISWVSSSRSTRLEQAAKRRLSSLLLPPLPPSSFVLSFSSPSATNPQNGFNSSLTSWTDRTSSRDRREEHPITACTAGTTESSRFALWELVRPWKAAGDRQCANANTTVTTAAPCLAPDTEDTTVVADCPGHTRWPRSRENTVAHTQHRRTPSSIVGPFEQGVKCHHQRRRRRKSVEVNQPRLNPKASSSTKGGRSQMGSEVN